METAIQIIWWIGLIGALIPTLIILKEVSLIIRTLKGIHKLSQITLKAAQGIADNVAVQSNLESLESPARNLRDAAGITESTVATIERRLEALSSSITGRGD